MSEQGEKEPADMKDLLRWAVETQRNINFIVGQQAQFSADLHRLQENFEERWKSADERWARTEDSIRALLAIAELHAQEIGNLAEAQARTDRQMAETDERLNALINFVERRVGGNSNGGTETRES